MTNQSKDGTFLWFIENYSYCWQKNGEKLVSPTFTTDELEGTSWSLGLYPRADKSLYESHVYITLRRNDDNGPDLFPMNFTLSIVTEDESDEISRKFEENFSKKFETGWYFIKMNEFLSEKKDRYLPNDILTVHCKFWTDKGNLDKMAPMCARTRIGIEHLSFLHTIEDFSESEPSLKPLHIQSRSKKECVISSNVHFTDDESCEKKIMVIITPTSEDHVLAKCKISLLDTTGNIIKYTEKDERFRIKRTKFRNLCLSLTKEAIVSKKSAYLPNDTLTLLCDCAFSTGIEFQQIEGLQNQITVKSKKFVANNMCIKDANVFIDKLAICPSIVDDLKNIYSSEFLPDVVLKTNTKSFPAHRVVLCARSPVFKAMMSNDMKEKNTSKIQVDDLEDNIVQQLLLFLYSDHIEDLQWNTATKLYYAADKYQIEKLKLLCSSFLIGSLTVSSVTEILILADAHGDSDLKKVVEDFIFEHETQVFGSEKWEKLIDEQPHLAVKTMQLKYKSRE